MPDTEAVRRRAAHECAEAADEARRERALKQWVKPTSDRKYIIGQHGRVRILTRAEVRDTIARHFESIRASNTTS